MIKIEKEEKKEDIPDFILFDCLRITVLLLLLLAFNPWQLKLFLECKQIVGIQNEPHVEEPKTNKKLISCISECPLEGCGIGEVILSSMGDPLLTQLAIFCLLYF